MFAFLTFSSFQPLALSIDALSKSRSGSGEVVGRGASVGLGTEVPLGARLAVCLGTGDAEDVGDGVAPTDATTGAGVTTAALGVEEPHPDKIRATSNEPAADFNSVPFRARVAV